MPPALCDLVAPPHPGRRPSILCQRSWRQHQSGGRPQPVLAPSTQPCKTWGSPFSEDGPLLGAGQRQELSTLSSVGPPHPQSSGTCRAGGRRVLSAQGPALPGATSHGTGAAAPPGRRGGQLPARGVSWSPHTCCPDKQPLGGWVPRSEGRRAQAAPPAWAGLQAARAPLELGAPGRSESGWGPGGLCSALGVPPAPSGVRGEWHDGTHHWWMNQVCGDLPESPGALSHGLRPQQPGPGRPPEWARLGRASWAGSAGLAPRPAVSCPRRQRGCPRPCRSWSWPPRSC